MCVRYRLRPVALEDAPFIVELRTDPSRNGFLHEVSPRVEDQVAWLEAYFARPGDYYFIVEDSATGAPQGTVGVYDVAADLSGAEWGRWILKPGSMAALESAWMIYETAFAKLGLASVSSRTLVDNGKVLSFHDNFGARRIAVLEGHFLVRGIRKSAVEHQITAEEWPAIRARHYAMAERFAHRLSPKAETSI
jgi:RimJ/RimL family protein N-acetyltransferase